MRHLVLGLCGLGLVAACDVGATGGAIDAAGSDGGGVDAPVDAPGCPSLWTTRAATGAGALIQGGALVLSASNIPVGAALEVYQVGFGGDFDVTFAVEAFTAGGAGAFVQAAVSEDVAQPPKLLTAGFVTSPAAGVRAADQPNGTSDVQATAATAGELRLVRQGATVTITATAGDTTATTTGNLAASPLRVGVQLGSTQQGTIGPTTTARIAGFTVAGGTGVTADPFDCNSLRP